MKTPKNATPVLAEGEKKLGRPETGEVREVLKMISFRVDEETAEALEKIVTASAGSGSMRARSTVLRRLILEESKKIV